MIRAWVQIADNALTATRIISHWIAQMYNVHRHSIGWCNLQIMAVLNDIVYNISPKKSHLRNIFFRSSSIIFLIDLVKGILLWTNLLVWIHQKVYILHSTILVKCFIINDYPKQYCNPLFYSHQYALSRSFVNLTEVSDIIKHVVKLIKSFNQVI